MAGAKGRTSSLSHAAAEAKNKEFNENLNNAMAAAIEATVKEAPEAKATRKKVKINLTLDSDVKDRLKAYADAKGVSISNLVAIWADEHGV